MSRNWRLGQPILPDGEPSEHVVLVNSLMALCEQVFNCETCNLPCCQVYDNFCDSFRGGNPTMHQVLEFLVDFSDLIKPMIKNDTILGHENHRGRYLSMPVRERPLVAQMSKLKGSKQSIRE